MVNEIDSFLIDCMYVLHLSIILNCIKYIIEDSHQKILQVPREFLNFFKENPIFRVLITRSIYKYFYFRTTKLKKICSTFIYSSWVLDMLNFVNFRQLNRNWTKWEILTLKVFMKYVYQLFKISKQLFYRKLCPVWNSIFIIYVS